MSGANPILLQFADVSVRFGTFLALDHIKLTVEDLKEKGEFITIIGPSGCGKSTLLNLVAGFLKPTEGQVLLKGQPIDGPGADRGMIFQKYSSFPQLTVLENVKFGLRLNRIDLGLDSAAIEHLAMKMIERVGLKAHENKYPHQLSGGQQQRVAIARTLVLKPRIILMDEPFSALDEPTRIEMQRILVELWHEAHPTILAVTHSISEAVYLGERVFIMTKAPGQIAYDIKDDIPPSVGEDPLVAQESPEFQRAVEVVGNCFQQVIRGET